MSSFCKQCSLDMFGSDHKELANLMPKHDYTAEFGAAVVCEDCGFIVVDIDGNCISEDCIKHGAENRSKRK